MRRTVSTCAVVTGLVAAVAAPSSALAWGRTGHAVVADIARGYLTPKAAAAVDALLASDTDTLTLADLGARASWADAYRAQHKETTGWHFANNQIDHEDLAGACYGFPNPPGLASQGPSEDCVVSKLEAFERELADPATTPAERLVAFKFVLHLVGDLHQPLHSGDNHDRGGNCTPLALGGPRTVNLHSYWDTVVVDGLGPDAETIAKALSAQITPAQRKTWAKDGPKAWALESYAVAKASAYTLGSAPGCASDTAPIALPDGYEAKARAAAALQLQRAGVRLAYELNRALG